MEFVFFIASVLLLFGVFLAIDRLGKEPKKTKLA